MCSYSQFPHAHFMHSSCTVRAKSYLFPKCECLCITVKERTVHTVLTVYAHFTVHRTEALRMTKAQVIPGPESMTEKELLRSIVAAAKECGWRVWHPWLSIHSARGFPDLFMAKGGRALAWELKTNKGKVTEAQQEWLEALVQVPGVDARVVRPADLEQAYRALIEGAWPPSVDESPK